MENIRIELWLGDKMEFAFELQITPLMAREIEKNKDKARFMWGLIESRKPKIKNENKN